MSSPTEMRRLFRRSILWLLPVVVVPLGALLVMQYRTLRALEQKTASAERNWLRGSLERGIEEMEASYRGASTTALTIHSEDLPNVASLGRHFSGHHVPGARTFFAMRFLNNMYETGYFDPAGKEKLPAEAEAEAVKMATVSWHVAHKWARAVPQPSLFVDERDPRHRVILRPVVDASMHVVGAVGVVLDERIARNAMTAMATKVVQKKTPNATVWIGQHLPRRAEFITQPLGFVFTNWRAGIRDMCETPEQMAAYDFKHNAMWTGGAFVVLLGAVLLSIGAVLRQARLSQMKSDFVSNVSHELRTPLSSIRVFGEYMRLGRVTQPEKVREYGEYIEAESRRLTALINNILDFSKIESAEKQYRFSDIDIVDFLECTVAAFAVPLRDQKISITFHSDTASRPQLRVDKDAIGQAVVNLLDNAVKYSNGRKEIEVNVATTRDALRISVRDYGIGIPPAEQKKIFEKFYRVGSGLVHDVKGSGLGLSIVQHVAKAHGGRVDVQSAPGEGSTFTIELPLAQSSEAPSLNRTEFA